MNIMRVGINYPIVRNKTDEEIHNDAIACANNQEFDEAIRIANTIENKTFLGFAKRFIAVEIAKSGDFERARELAQTIDFKKAKGPELKDEVLAEINKMEAKKRAPKKVKEKEEVVPLKKSPLNEVIDEALATQRLDLKIYRLYQITMGLAKIGNYKKAKKVLDLIPDPVKKAKAQVDIVEIQTRRNQSKSNVF